MAVLWEKKGATVLLAALRVLADQNYNLRVVGDGPLRQELQGLAAGLPVTFLGALHRAELAREYAAASVIVFPVRASRERGPGWFAGGAARGDGSGSAGDRVRSPGPS